MNKIQMAEEYALKHFAEAPKYVKEDTFLAGWDARDQDLRESSEEFDPEEIRALARTYLSTHKATLGNIDAALHQFKKDQLKYQALFSAYSKLDNINIELNHRIADLKAEIENSNKFAQGQETRIQELEAELANANKFAQDQENHIQELEAVITKMDEYKSMYEDPRTRS